jgi:hypothetical protein
MQLRLSMWKWRPEEEKARATQNTPSYEASEEKIE